MSGRVDHKITPNHVRITSGSRPDRTPDDIGSCPDVLDHQITPNHVRITSGSRPDRTPDGIGSCPDVSTRKSPRNTGSTPDQLRITLDHVRPTSGSPDDIGSTGARPDHDRITHVRMCTGECHRSDHRYTSGSRLAFCHVNTCRKLVTMPFSSPHPPLSQEHRQTPRFLSPFAPIPNMPSLRPLSH